MCLHTGLYMFPGCHEYDIPPDQSRARERRNCDFENDEPKYPNGRHSSAVWVVFHQAHDKVAATHREGAGAVQAVRRTAAAFQSPGSRHRHQPGAGKPRACLSALTCK